MKKPNNVDACIAAAPKEAAEQVNEIRALIKKTAPAAEERITKKPEVLSQRQSAGCRNVLDDQPPATGHRVQRPHAGWV